MSIFNWNNNYSIGIEEIDEQHKTLFNLFADLRNAAREGKSKEFISVALSKLDDYARMHFSLEEKYMLEYQYPDFELHKSKHQQYLISLDKLRDQLDPEDLSSTIRLLDFLIQWISGHIIESDKGIGIYLRKKKGSVTNFV